MKRPHEMVGGRLRRRVRGVGRVRRLFGDPARLSERAIDLVRRDVQETEGILGRARQFTPVIARGLEQHQRAGDVGLDERRRAVDGTVDVAFRREIDNRLRSMPAQQRTHQRAIADVALHEHVVRVVGDGCERVEVARISQRIEIDDFRARRHRLQHEVAAYEAGASGDQDGVEMFAHMSQSDRSLLTWRVVRRRALRQAIRQQPFPNYVPAPKSKRGRQPSLSSAPTLAPSPFASSKTPPLSS